MIDNFTLIKSLIKIWHFNEMQHQIQATKHVSCGKVGQVPILVRIKETEWRKKKSEVLSYCLNLLEEKQDGNIIILHDEKVSSSNEVESILKRITNREIILGDHWRGMSSDVEVLDQANEQITVVTEKHFTGCEANSAIYLTFNEDSFINSLTNRVPNLICIQVLKGLNTLGNIYNLTRFGENSNLKCIKEDNTFY